MKRYLICSLVFIGISFSMGSGQLLASSSRSLSSCWRPHQQATNPQQIFFNVKNYGAKADGKTNDANAINKAINAAAKAGGGTVFFPAGTYLSGTIRLKSKITLYLSSGTILQAIYDSTAYDKPEPNPYDMYQDFGHSHWHDGFIWGENLHDIAIIGSGMIYGKGLTRNISRDHLPKGLGDKSIALKNCHNVLLRDFKMLHGGHFGILVTGVDNLTIDGTFKLYDPDFHVSHTGRIKMGTESNGGFKNIALRFMDFVKVKDVPLYKLKNTDYFTLFQSPPFSDQKLTHAVNKDL